MFIEITWTNDNQPVFTEVNDEVNDDGCGQPDIAYKAKVTALATAQE